MDFWCHQKRFRLKFHREGIKYDDLSDEEKDQWDEIEWNEGGPVPNRVEAEAVNKWLFNDDTVDKVLAHLMTHGQTVAGGDRLGKTILFAKNQKHADFIAERFNKNYPHYRGEFARVITFETEYVQSLIDSFSNKDKAPHLAISVDMLDTGIDVPEVLNLVFFKLVRSQTKFWQMVGRGTRLCPDVFGPGQDKAFFYLFDYCQNLEFFSQQPGTTEATPAKSLGKRLFDTRLEVIGVLDHLEPEEPKVMQDAQQDLATNKAVREALSGMLHQEVAAMNLENFVVRSKRRLVEKYAQPEAWIELPPTSVHELVTEVSGLPSELESEPEEAKRFDLRILNTQLALLRSEPRFVRLQTQIKEIAALLEEKASIPMVHAQIDLIEEVQTDDWWQDVTVPMLERVRRRLRDLVRLIEKQHRQPIYTNFEDEIGTETRVDLLTVSPSNNFEKFCAKARAFLRAHQEHESIRKLRLNQALHAGDLLELERLLAESGVGDAAQIEQAKTVSHGLGLFVRSLVGLDREAAKAALGEFLTRKPLTANQVEFINLVINHLTEHGVMDASLLYESPFTDLTPRGPDGLFESADIDALMGVLQLVRTTAMAA
jgi:type I restriction enzyme, R subunit